MTDSAERRRGSVSEEETVTTRTLDSVSSTLANPVKKSAENDQELCTADGARNILNDSQALSSFIGADATLVQATTATGETSTSSQPPISPEGTAPQTAPQPPLPLSHSTTENEENEYGDGNDDDDDDNAHNDENPPLPPGTPPESSADDGWQPVWDNTYGSYYFYNALTGETTWTNPRVPEASNIPPIALSSNESASPEPTTEFSASAAGPHDYTPPENNYNPLQYNPAIHGDYDPTAPYAQEQDPPDDPTAQYAATAAFNRFTGKFQAAGSRQVPENYNDENKSKRQMEFYFDVDAAANSHDGKSLKAERQTKKLSKKELKQFKEKRRQRKEEKRKAWLKD